MHVWTSPRTGTERVSVGSDYWPASVFVRSGSCTGSEVGCTRQTNQFPTSTVSFAAHSGTTYWIFARAEYSIAVVGLYDLTVTAPP